MSKAARAAVVWTILGMFLMGLLVWFVMPHLMLVDQASPRSYDETVSMLDAKLASHGDWRVLAVNDYQRSVASFASIPRAGSINVCNPRYASRILANEKDRGVTAFMPLAIGVYEDANGQVHVSRLNVGLVGMMFGGTIADVMGMAGADLEAIVASVTAE